MNACTFWGGTLLLFSSLFFWPENAAGQQGPVNYTRLIAQYEGQAPASIPPATLYPLAAAYEQTHRFERAVELYRVYFERDTAQVYVLADMARAAGAAGRTKEAVAYLERAVRTESEDYYLLYRLASAYYADMDYERTADVCSRMFELGHENAQVWLLAGQASQAMGFVDPALIQYAEAWRHQPRSRTPVLQYLNLLLRHWMRWEDDLDTDPYAMCDSVLAYHPADAEVLMAKGILHYRMGEYEPADETFTALLERGDSSRSVMRYAGLARVHAGDNLGGSGLLNLALESDSTDVAVMLALGDANLKIGRYGETESVLDLAEEVLRYPERQYTLETIRGNLYSKLGQPERSVAHFYRAYRVSPHAVQLLNTMYSQMRYRTGESEAYKEKSLFLLHELIVRYYESAERMPDRALWQSFSRLRDGYEDLGLCLEDAFFKSAETLPMRSPDGVRSTVRVETLRGYFDRLRERFTPPPRPGTQAAK